MRIFISLFLTLLFATACNADQNSIKNNLEARFPGIHVDSVSKSPLPGLYEVVVDGDHVVYVDQDAKYLLEGALMETATRRNLTQEKIDKLTAVNFNSLLLQQAIKIVHGNGARRLAVFSDPDCPFCRRLEPELAQLKNVTIYVFEYPLPMHTDAARKARVIWCSPDRAKAWDDFMLRGKLPEGKGDCPNPIDANLALGQKLNVQGTPNIILPNGQRIPGLVPADRLAKMLDAASGN